MSGECDKCGEHALECTCEALCRPQQNAPKTRYSNLSGAMIALGIHLEPPGEKIPVKYVNVRGRAEHEALLKDANKCKELRLDQMYEIMVYLKRWGNWLSD